MPRYIKDNKIVNLYYTGQGNNKTDYAIESIKGFTSPLIKKFRTNTEAKEYILSRGYKLIKEKVQRVKQERWANI